MDWKDVLRRRLASPNTDPKSEFRRDRPPDSPPGARSGGGDDGEEEEVRVTLAASGKLSLTKESERSVLAQTSLVNALQGTKSGTAAPVCLDLRLMRTLVPFDLTKTCNSFLQLPTRLESGCCHEAQASLDLLTLSASVSRVPFSSRFSLSPPFFNFINPFYIVRPPILHTCLSVSLVKFFQFSTSPRAAEVG